MASTEPAIRLVVCDAGPVIHLDELGCLALLSDFAAVLILDTVWEEVLHHRPQAIDHCQSWARRVTPNSMLPPDLEATTRLFSLHAGEIQAINFEVHLQGIEYRKRAKWKTGLVNCWASRSPVSIRNASWRLLSAIADQ